ncbi:cysteinylglycine-S-conjugate dipeptidase-like [Schistocerca gregaria]|uniref:cysteinylglycine-S-conjugate dipeptidase-like n=1 Tax=Schistocerca gregaria TaxID=7010 RepID=UPI00211E594A|nr:cysteinylglycine-S-conjugate dipeptidase-like [Schistocerca gregaria]
MDPHISRKFINGEWEDSILPALKEYVSIHNVSPAYDKNWETNGYIDHVVELFTGWILSQNLRGMYMEVYREEGRTPLILVEIEPSSEKCADRTVLLYGHMDKQPPLLPWDDGLHPYRPVIRDGLLYGRGCADDGYALFSSVAAIRNLQVQNLDHARCLIMIESGEESGSPDLPYYMEKLSSKIGKPDFIICLDSGCGNYEQLWLTTSLRGLVSGTLTVQILERGVHSGHASGIVPSSFRIIRQLLDRIEDPDTGVLKIPELNVEIPPDRVKEAERCAQSLGSSIADEFPFIAGSGPVSTNYAELLLNRCWRPTLSITGVDGLPSLSESGNVLRSHTSLQLSVRVPPTADASLAAEALKRVLEADPPYGARVSFVYEKSGAGWNAATLSPWASQSFDNSSMEYFGKHCDYMGEGGSIPLINLLANHFPQSQLCVTGLLGPDSNAHGPNERLDIEYAKKLTCCISQIIYDHANPQIEKK